MSTPDLQAALAEASTWLDDVPDVVAVGQGEELGEATVDVWVSKESARTDRLPASLYGVPIRVREAGGPIEAQ